MRGLLLLLAVAGALLAQTPTAVTVQFGGLSCGAVRRGSALVQTYCYQYPANPTWILVHNEIDSLPAAGGRVMPSFQWCESGFAPGANQCRGTLDSIVWQFNWNGVDTISWSYVWDGKTIHSGVFP